MQRSNKKLLYTKAVATGSSSPLTLRDADAGNQMPKTALAKVHAVYLSGIVTRALDGSPPFMCYINLNKTFSSGLLGGEDTATGTEFTFAVGLETNKAYQFSHPYQVSFQHPVDLSQLSISFINAETGAHVTGEQLAVYLEFAHDADSQ